MSWAEVPGRIIPTYNAIIEALDERRKFFISPDSILPPPVLDIPSPYRSVAFNSIRSGIKQLYREHFPPSGINGEWTPPRPYENCTDEEIEDAIAAELQAANINPADFFYINPPTPICNGNFIRACYHLLNNVLIYCIHVFTLHAHSRTTIWYSYDHSKPDGDPDEDYIEDRHFLGGPGDYIMWGRLEKQRQYNFDVYWAQDDRKGINGGAFLKGSWKARYTVEIEKSLGEPQSETDQRFYERYTLPGTTEVNFNGTTSDYIPRKEDVLRDADYYRCWGNFKYGFVYSCQRSTITEISITKENYPEINYQYFDL